MRSRKSLLRLTVIALVALTVLFAFAASAFAAPAPSDIYVDAWVGDDLLGDGSAGSPYRTIGHGVYMSGPGSTVHVGGGIYLECVDLPSNISVVGAGAGTTFVVPETTDSVFSMYEVSNVTVEGITFSGATAELGACIRVDYCDSISIDYCVFENSDAEYGAGIYLYDSAVSIYECGFGDLTSYEGSGVYVTGVSQVDVEDSHFYRCASEGDGGAFFYDIVDHSCAAYLSNCQFVDCSGEDGGAVDVDNDGYSGAFEMYGCYFRGNDSLYDSGAADVEAIDPWIEDCEFYDNECGVDQAGGSGGALWVGNTEGGTVTDNFFSGNYSRYEGGALSVENSMDIEITDNQFYENSADAEGGALYFDAVDNAWVEDNYFESNSSREDGGALAAGYSYFDVEYCDFYDNEAQFGGAVSVWDCNVDFYECDLEGNAAIEDGGAMSVFAWGYDRWVDVNDSYITSNTAGGDGGGIYFEAQDEYNGMGLEYTDFYRNTATGSGGGIFFEGYDYGDSLHLDDCTLEENAALEGDGGGLYAANVDSDLCLWDNEYDGNTAAWSGGGVFAMSSDGCGSQDEYFTGNRAAYGAGMYVSDGYMEIDDDDFESNYAFVPEGGEGGGDGGAIYATNYAYVACDSSGFLLNEAEGTGGAICDWTTNPSTHWTNGVYELNSASSGTAATTYGASTFAFNTYYSNYLRDGEWGPTIYSADPFSRGASIITNSIFEGNNASEDVDGFAGTPPTYSYTYEIGAGNIAPDWPGAMLVDDGYGHLRLSPGSMCIDAGSPAYYALGWDHDDNSRPVDRNGDEVAQYDMGAFELAAPAAPYSWDGWFDTSEDVPLDLSRVLVEFARDPNGDPLTFSMATGPSNGLAVVLPNGSFIYAPKAEFSGSDAFTFRAYDGTSYSETSTIYVQVYAVNDAPEALNDEFDVNEDSSAYLDILANDTDPDAEWLDGEILEGPSHGTVEMSEGEAYYTPEAGYVGSDEFTYRAYDGESYSETALVSVNVLNVNDAPVAVEDTATVVEDGSVIIEVLANDSDADGDAVGLAAVNGSANGSLEALADGTILFTPYPDFNGSTSFTYSATDGILNSEPATVTVEVTPVNDAPSSGTNYYSCDEDGQIVVNAPGVLENDSDIDGDVLSARLDSEPGNGTVQWSGDGSFVYTPNANVTGHFHMYYSAFDGQAYSPSRYVCLNVGAVNDAPTVTDDDASCDEDGSTSLNVLGNDSDVDGNELTAELKTDPANGTVTLAANGDAVYTPAEDWSGTDTFTYRAYDGTEYSVIGVVTVVVAPVNDAPAAAPESYEVDENTLLTVEAPGVLANDSDIDGDALSTSLETDPAGGELNLAADGGFTYMPDPGFYGEDTFEYYANDGDAYSQLVTVTITVNDTTAPVTGSDAVALYSDVATITLSPTDSGSGVAHTYYSLDGAVPVEGTVIEAFVLGDHSVSFWSEDNAGNVEEAVFVEFTIESAGTAFGEISGESRYETAVEASKDAFAKGSECVLVATGEMWPDALGSAALAGVSDAPILLTQRADLPAEVAAEIERLDATRAYVVGGTGAVSEAVVLELEALGLDVTRLGGADRYATARIVAEEVAAVAGDSFDDTCFVATGAGFPDSLAAGPLSAKTGWPLMLAGADGLDDEALVALVDMGIKNVIILGGNAAVPAAVETELNVAFGNSNVSRISGSDRYATAVEVARYGVAECGLAFDGMAIATGQTFPDALAAGPMQAKAGSVLVCTPSTYLHDSVRLLLIGQRAMINDVRFVGGTAAVSMPVRNAVADALR